MVGGEDRIGESRGRLKELLVGCEVRWWYVEGVSGRWIVYCVNGKRRKIPFSFSSSSSVRTSFSRMIILFLATRALHHEFLFQQLHPSLFISSFTVPFHNFLLFKISSYFLFTHFTRIYTLLSLCFPSLYHSTLFIIFLPLFHLRSSNFHFTIFRKQLRYFRRPSSASVRYLSLLLRYQAQFYLILTFHF